MTLRQLIDKAGGRKFILTAYVVLAATGLLVGEYINQETWKTIVLFALGIYGTANVSQRIGTARSTSRETSDPAAAQAAR
jgi:hypothetical protein